MKKSAEYLQTTSRCSREEKLERALEENKGLVWSIVRRFPDYTKYEDYFQVGVEGLIKAVDVFDPDKAEQLCTIAYPYIEGSIRRYIRDMDGNSLIRTPRRLQELVGRVYSEQCRHGLSAKDACEKLGESYDQYLEGYNSMSHLNSLQESYYGDDSGDDLTLEEHIPNSFSLEDTYVENTAIKEKYKIVKSMLSDDEILVFNNHLHKIPQRETAERLGWSQMQVSRKLRDILALCKRVSDRYDNNQPMLFALRKTIDYDKSAALKEYKARKKEVV